MTVARVNLSYFHCRHHNVLSLNWRYVNKQSPQQSIYPYVLRPVSDLNKSCQQLSFKHSWFQTFAMFCMLYVFFWVIPRRLNFICRRFGTLCLFHLHRRVGKKMEQTECSEMSAYKIQTPGNYPEESIQHHFDIMTSFLVAQEDIPFLVNLACTSLLNKTIYHNLFFIVPTHALHYTLKH